MLNVDINHRFLSHASPLSLTHFLLRSLPLRTDTSLSLYLSSFSFSFAARCIVWVRFLHIKPILYTLVWHVSPSYLFAFLPPSSLVDSIRGKNGLLLFLPALSLPLSLPFCPSLDPHLLIFLHGLHTHSSPPPSSPRSFMYREGRVHH